ncbi:MULTISPECIES: cupin domain-containing protein [Streptomyces]|uniref:cupin domain-containing protein n=1 Tax=Streptomyces TaxID=1883 RepID=UPI00211B01A3|nr:cupin domain-containing protein [Streptomyces sp. CS057]
MSLNLLLPEPGVAALLTSWPDEPCVYEREAGELDRVINPESIDHYLETGCVPADEIAVVSNGAALHPDRHRTAGRTDPVKLRNLYEDGHTIRLGNLQRVVPFLADVSRGIQRETGFSNYLHAFVTPPGRQGLRHHWDQQMAVIVQISGIKRWQLWRPMFPSPMRAYQESFRVWDPGFIPQWEAAGPDLEVDLRPGQSLLLPRGWVHNPHVLDAQARSIHLTFAIRERTPLWVAEKLVDRAVEKDAFRRVILPCDITGQRLSAHVRDVRQALIEHLAGLDVNDFAQFLYRTAVSEKEYTT